VAEAVGKRRFHAFLSHAHVDKALADNLYHFLSEIAGIPIWYDAVDLPPGATILDNLFDGIENSRAAVILLSQRSVTKGWVQKEYQAAINHQTQYPDFRVVPVRLDDVEPPNFLQNYSNIQIGPDGLDPAVAAHILRALYQPQRANVDPLHGRYVYLSRSWRTDDFESVEAASAALLRAGLCIVGDAEDRQSWKEERIGRIMSGCGAFAAVLPYRRSAQYMTSSYILREWKLAVDQGLPCLVIPHPDVDLPVEMKEQPGLAAGTDDAGQLHDYAVNLSDEWRSPQHELYVFFATDFGAEGKALRKLITETVTAVTGLPCRIGEYVPGISVQSEILRMVGDALLVLAEISGDSPNVYIEIGAARASGVPVALLRSGPPGRPTFMLRDQQVYDYATEAELIAWAVRVSYPYRRFLRT
jgi:TIR domain